MLRLKSDADLKYIKNAVPPFHMDVMLIGKNCLKFMVVVLP